MPFNVTAGTTGVIFTAVFFDASGAITDPPSATVTITYPPVGNSLTTVSCALAMSPSGQKFTASWDSTVAALGLSSASISAPGVTSADPQTIRIVS